MTFGALVTLLVRLAFVGLLVLGVAAGQQGALGAYGSIPLEDDGKPDCTRDGAAMSTFWSLFIIVGTLGNNCSAPWLLLSNRTKPTRPSQTTGHDFDGIEEYENPLPLWWVGLFVVTIVFAAAISLYYPGIGNFPGVAIGRRRINGR